MKRSLLAAVGLAVSVGHGLTQAPDALAPSSVTPKTVPPGPTPPVKLALPKSPRPNPAGDKPIIAEKPTLAITAIVIVKSRGEVQENVPAGVTGLQVRGLPFLNKPDFTHEVQPFLGKLLTENAIRDLEDKIILYCRRNGKPLVDVILVPEQNIENGVIQLWLLEGKVEKITVKNEGRKWFSDELILRGVRLKGGDPVNSDRLAEDLNWLNANPFRQVDVMFKPGDKLGMTDLQLQVEDRFPIRPYFGYENSGTRFTGEDRLLAGFNWGNVFGLDHQLNYQYSTDVDFDLVKAHSASYLIPLPWRHNIMFYGSYVDGKADFSSTGSITTSDARSWQTSVRYSVPLPNFHNYRHEASVGFDFKRSNNDLLAGGTNILNTSETDIAQFGASYTGLLPDHFGQTTFGAEAYYSPGGMTGDNKDQAFNALRTNAPANYFYARINAERVTRLPYNFSWVLRGWGQISTDRLLPSEELALGGYNTIRGYDERVVIGDNGWIINNELRSPPIPFLVFGLQNQLQLLGFFDYGEVRTINPIPADGSPVNHTLYSTGVGARYTINRNLAFRFDYGFPLTEKSINEHTSRAHFGVLLSF